MSGKRAKPSRWRFLRFAPLVMITVVVWVMVGLFLLFPGSGDNRAHDRGLGPVPSGGPGDDPATSPARPADSSGPTATAAAPTTTPAPEPTASLVADSGSPQPQPTSTRTTSSAPAPKAPTPRTTSDPTGAAPTRSRPGSRPDQDNPGKKKGHHDGHGPNDDRP